MRLSRTPLGQSAGMKDLKALGRAAHKAFASDAKTKNEKGGDLSDALVGALGHFAPAKAKATAIKNATANLREAIASREPKRLKAALIAADRVDANHVPEYKQAKALLQELKRGRPTADLSQDLKGSDVMARVSCNDPNTIAMFQRLLDLTHTKVYTRDRKGEGVPERLIVHSVEFANNRNSWVSYLTRRSEIRKDVNENRAGVTPVLVDTNRADVPKYVLASEQPAGPPSSSSVSQVLAAHCGLALDHRMNEVFLFHGTSSEAADAIMEKEFKISKSGSQTGTLYGRGLYLSESPVKADEYTTLDSSGLRTMLLCRTVLGKVYYSDVVGVDGHACEEACVSGDCHSVLGDRRKARGTFREFVVFDEGQLYANYVIKFQRHGVIFDPGRSFMVTVPPGCSGGEVLVAQSPEKKEILIRVPPGAVPGQTFQAQC